MLSLPTSRCWNPTIENLKRTSRDLIMEKYTENKLMEKLKEHEATTSKKLKEHETIMSKKTTPSSSSGSS
jgi:hypothetical protein